MLKFTIMGAGGVGAFYAAKLKESGNFVQVLARRKHLEQIRKKGIRINYHSDSFSTTIDRAEESVDNLEDTDVVIVAVKAFQVKDIMSELNSIVSEDTLLIPIQNGVETFSELKRSFPKQTLGGTARGAAYIESPGVIRQVSQKFFFTFGSEDGEITGKMNRVKEAFDGAGIECNISTQILRDMWEKFIVMSTFGGVGSITQAPIGVILSNKKTKKLIENSIEEVYNLGKAQGVDIDENSKSKAMKFLSSLPPETTNSLQRDIANGKPSEIDYLSGTVVRLGSQLGVQVPLHDFIYSSLLPRELRARAVLNF